MRRVLVGNVKSWAVLFLLGAQAVFAPLAAAQQATLTGWFTITVADYPTESGFVSETTYALTEDSGERHELLIDIDLMRPLGGPVALNRKRVTVVGEWKEGGPDAPAQFRVSAIQLDPLRDERTTPEGAYRALQATSQTAVTGSQAWVTILCRFADARNVTPRPVSHYEKLMGLSYPGLDHYWRELSEGNINLTGSQVVGWYNLPQPRSYYLTTKNLPNLPGGGEDFRTDRAVEDCTAVADADVFFPDFDGINLIFNHSDADVAASRGGPNWLTLDGQTRFWGVTWIHPAHSETYPQTIAHEMGHAFGLQHSSGPYGQDDPAFSDTTYDSEWDVMSGGISLAPYPGYGHLGVHTIAYHKDFLGWIPPNRKYVAQPNTTRTITLERLAQPGSGGYLLAQIPIGDSDTDFYTVETRLFAGYDEEIPDEAVVIHKVDTTREDRLAQVVDVDNDGDTNDAGAMWTVGETFADLANGLQVSIDAAWSTSYRVTIDYTVCADTLSPARQLLRERAGSASVRVVAPSGCRWVAESDSPWITITAGSSGNGDGRVHYRVAANPSLNARTGTLSIGGRTVTVIQVGANGNLFEDDMESGTAGWRETAPWAVTQNSSHNGTRAWRWQYRGESNTPLWSSVIDLTGVESATLTFWHRFTFTGDGMSHVWVAPQNGQQGTEITSFTGTQGWTQVSLDLSPFVGQSITLAFNVFDTTNAKDNWYIDDVVVFTSDFAPPAPDPYLFEDDMESGTNGWWGNTPWAQTTASAHSGTWAWTDSPGGNYQNDLNVSSLSPVIDLTEVDSATLTFWHRYDFGRGDEGNVWIARYGEWEGQDGWWFRGAPLQTFTGMQSTWQQTSIDLTPFVGERIRLGFQLLSDASETADGWYIDDVAVFSSDFDTLPPSPQARLENPSAGSFQSGISIISGWACEAQEIVIELAGTPVPAAYGTPRGDTQSVCGDSNNGFSLLVNWNNLGPGEHPVRALVDGVEFARTTVRVTTLGVDFLRDVRRTVVVPDFPHSGETTTLRWEESRQNFLITDDQPNQGGGHNRVAGLQAMLENPSLGSSQSGIGIISGWACEAGEIVIELAGTPVPAAYGTPRGDTQPVCGDANNGFVLLVNWNNLGPGEHEIRALADGLEFARTTVRVTTLGVDFLRDVRRTVVVSDFPHPGESTTLRWEESLQNFVIIP